jgi:hypothetical protein
MSYGITVEEYMIGQCIAGLMANPKIGEMLYIRTLNMNHGDLSEEISRIAVSQAKTLMKVHKDACNWHKG